VVLHSGIHSTRRPLLQHINILVNLDNMSNTSPFFRRRKIGRASSPPTWACYEQIVDSFDDDGDSDSTSGSDDGEECPPRDDVHSDSEDSDRNGHVVGTRTDKNPVDGNDHAHDMEIDGEGASNAHDLKKDVKGKQRAVEPELDSPKSRKERRPRRTHVETLRPILTIHRSQGFVWNQVCSLNASLSLVPSHIPPSGSIRASVHQGSMHVHSLYPFAVLLIPKYPIRYRHCLDFPTQSESFYLE
jgi:hypothetical protein